MCISLTDCITNLESNISKDLAVLIEKKVKHGIGKAKQEMNGKLSKFQEKINTLEAKVTKVEKSYSTAVNNYR